MTMENPNKYIEVEMREMLRGDVILWLGVIYTVLSVDCAEVESELKGAQIYLWLVRGGRMDTPGRRKSIQGLPDTAMVRRKVDDTSATAVIDDGPDDFDDAAE